MSAAVESTDWVHFTGDERVLWAGTPSVYPVVPVLAVGFGVGLLGVWLARDFALSGVLAWLALALLPVGVLVGMRAYLVRWSTRYVFTTKAVYEKTGLFSRTVTRVGLDRVQNTTFDQSSIERLLSYGDIAVYTAGTGGTDLFLRDVPDPEGVNALVTTELSERAIGSQPESPSVSERPTA